MKNRNTRWGFTLIELLVVVLIIGILVAVAVPQYQKVVNKMRFVESAVIFNSLSKAMDTDVLENGYPNGTRWFTGQYNNSVTERLDIKIPWTKCEEHLCYSKSDTGSWSALCQPSGCYIYLWNSSVMNGVHLLYMRASNSSEWYADLPHHTPTKTTCSLIRDFFGTNKMSDTLKTKCGY